MLFLLLVAVIILGIYLFRRDHPVQKDAMNIALWRVAWGFLAFLVTAGLIANAVGG